MGKIIFEGQEKRFASEKKTGRKEGRKFPSKKGKYSPELRLWGKRGNILYRQSKKRVTVNIMGEEHVLRATSSPEHLKKVARHVEKIMQELADNNPYMSRHKIAVLASMNLADELLRLKEEEEQGEPPDRREEDDELV